MVKGGVHLLQLNLPKCIEAAADDAAMQLFLAHPCNYRPYCSRALLPREVSNIFLPIKTEFVGLQTGCVLTVRGHKRFTAAPTAATGQRFSSVFHLMPAYYLIFIQFTFWQGKRRWILNIDFRCVALDWSNILILAHEVAQHKYVECLWQKLLFWFFLR